MNINPEASQLDPSAVEQLPMLQLTPVQSQIIGKHLEDAITKICTINFGVATEDALRQQLLNHAFEHGRRVAYSSMLTFDQEQFQRTLERETASSNSQTV